LPKVTIEHLKEAILCESNAIGVLFRLPEVPGTYRPTDFGIDISETYSDDDAANIEVLSTVCAKNRVQMWNSSISLFNVNKKAVLSKT